MRESELAKMSSQEIVNLIFLPGLSTAEKVSDISGRGVGMDVVRTNIEKVGGNITIETEIGKGTTILLRLPLTLAIIPSLVIETCQFRFAVPQVNLLELVYIKASEVRERIEKVGSSTVMRLRGKLLPLVRLADTLELDRFYTDEGTGELSPDRREEIADTREGDNITERSSSQSDYYILVLKVGNGQFGLIVEKLFDMEEIVVKPLSEFIKHCQCFSGTTIMGDGRVAMILDATGIFNKAQISIADIQIEEKRLKISEEQKDVNSQKSFILFSNALNEVFAMPLEDTMRLEKFERDRIERVGSREYLTYSNKSIELYRLEDFLPVGQIPDGSNDLYLLLPKEGQGKIGIIATSIIDTLQTSVELDDSTIKAPGVYGTAVINDHMTVFINANAIVREGKPVKELSHAC